MYILDQYRHYCTQICTTWKSNPYNPILLTVRDNGAGMDEEQLKTLLDAPKQDSDHGYGVFNIDQRLKICYGPAFGLTYRLPEKSGVLVEIRIPYQTDL